MSELKVLSDFIERLQRWTPTLDEFLNYYKGEHDYYEECVVINFNNNAFNAELDYIENLSLCTNLCAGILFGNLTFLCEKERISGEDEIYKFAEYLYPYSFTVSREGAIFFYDSENEIFDLFCSNFEIILKFLEYYYRIDYCVSLSKKDEFISAITELESLKIITMNNWQTIFFGPYCDNFDLQII